MRIIKTLLWIFVIVILSFIFHFSAQPAAQSNKVSTELTEDIINIIPPIRKLPDSEKESIVRSLNDKVRKYAHFLLYLLLGLVMFSALYFSAGNSKITYLWLLTLVLCLLYAVSDEIHQIFVPGRGCQATDVIIDFTGSFVGSGVAVGLVKITSR